MDPTEAPSHDNPPKTTTPPKPPTTHSPEEIDRLLESWKISPETHDHILHTRILPTVLRPFLPPKDNDDDKDTPKRQPLAGVEVEGEKEGKGGEEKGEGKADDKLSSTGGPMPLRLTPRIVHDESLEGVRGAVEWLDGEGASISYDKGRVDRVVVLRRGMKVVYANERTAGGGWEKQPAALKALEGEWARPLTEDERHIMDENIKMLKSLGKPEVDKEIEEIQRLIAELGATDGTIPDATPFDPVDFVHKELPS
ncbi:hypothetical protein F5144DRAFT_621780 [Chaetomium tenue]|uniref:Uncharacterized protein n=1 Tax=Chaetomium tenue TaxID=1854479 RepID=A0ACB7P428_9PEZI|nr:hypothetical protein F5144DRAFT_621780 [Chaetomium globosum]